MIMHFTVFVIAFVFNFLQLTQSGRILNGDLWIDYANAGSMTELAFSFMLESPIDETDYIKVSLPFPLHSSLVPAYPATTGLSLPYGLYITYQQVDDSSNIQPTALTCQALTQSIDSSKYFIRFYDADRKTILPISANKWYHLKFKMKDQAPLEYQKADSILQIQMSTVSSVFSNAMVYDDNLAFGYFQLGSSPPQGITLKTTPANLENAGDYLLTQASYDLYLDVTLDIPTYHFKQNLKLVFFISQDLTKTQKFKFDGQCKSLAKTNSPTIDLLDDDLYTCNVDLATNLMTVFLKPEALTKQTQYRFTVKIINPPIAFQGIDITVKAIKQVSGLILSKGTDENALSTNQIYITSQQIFIGWGLRPDALLPFNARVFRGDSATPTYMPYNSLFTKFSVSQTTSDNIELKIQINIPSQSAAHVLETGFTHNLPAFTNKEVKCVIEYESNTIKRAIVCTGIGSLDSTKKYQIGWKMFFPYDNYESNIDCTQFGLITIYTAQAITELDNVFFLGRGDQFLEFMKSSDEYSVIGRNSSYITYMKTFTNLNLVVLSTDFQQFLKIPEEIVVTNRPKDFTNKKFNDVYVVGQNLAFMKYLQQFQDIYVAYKLKSNSDIIKRYDTLPLVATSMPKNTLTITTSNSKNWLASDSQPPISSSATLGGKTPTTSLAINPGTDQSLIFHLSAPFAEVSSTNPADSTVTDKWGMLIMMNPKIKKSSAASGLFENGATLTHEIETVDTPTAYNKYTLITLKGSSIAGIKNNFPESATDLSIGVEKFIIEDFSSLVADDENFDIMIATIDGIDGPLNKVTYNGYFLINGFSLTTTALSTIKTSFVAYQNTPPMDGSKVPTLFRVQGTVTGTTDFHTLNLFFDKLEPFFENYHNGDIVCKKTTGNSYCKFYRGTQIQLSNQQKNYLTFSRIQIPLTTPDTAFDILIPITNEDSKTNINFHLGYSEKDPATGRIYIRNVQPVKLFSQTGTSSTSGTFGPDLTGKELGQTVTDISSMKIKSDQGSIVQNDATEIGAAFLYFSEWDYFKESKVSWPNGPCYMMQYLLYSTNYDDFVSSGTPFTYTYKNMKGAVCFCDTGDTTSGSFLSFQAGSTLYLPAKYGLQPVGFGGYSLKNGNLKYLNTNSDTFAAALTLTDEIVTPTMGPLLIKSIGQWIIPLPVQLTDKVQIIFTATTNNLPFTSPTGQGKCSVSVNDTQMPISCTYTSSLIEMDYILQINERDLLPAGTELQIIHYGLTTNSSSPANIFDLKVYTRVLTNAPGANQLIFTKTGVSFKYEATDPTYIGKSLLTLSSFHQITDNKAAVTNFNFSFTLLSKGLYILNRVRIDLGQYHIDNAASLISPSCKIYEYDTKESLEYSHDWESIDTSKGFDNLQFWPKRNLIANNLTYTVKCSKFVATSTSSPVGISGKIVYKSEDLTGQLSTTSAISLTTLTSLPKSNQIEATKSFTIPSSLLEIQFKVTSPGVTEDSIIYIGFPTYYADGLGSDVKCYTTKQIYCKVFNGRQLMIRYVGTFQQGTQFVIEVVGVSQPVNYKSGTFYFVIDDDDNKKTVISSGTFIDSVSSSVLDTQNFPAFQILSFSQSSRHLREEEISLQMEFYIPSSLGTVTVGQYLFLVFPPNFGNVLRFVEPICTLNIRDNSLKNYISSCQVKGIRIKMPFLDDIVLGSVYNLKIQGIINPINPSSNVYKYALQISSKSGDSIVARSFSPHANFEMPIFIVNPQREALNFYTVENGLITNLTTTVNIQSEEVFISPDNALTNSYYSRNVYLEPVNNLYSEPSKLELNSGQNPFPFRLSGLVSGVNYIFFKKTGDGNYYSSLPPLTLLINRNQFTPISFLETGFSLPIAAVNTNYTLAVTLPFQLYPISGISVQVKLSTTSVGLQLRESPTIISFYPGKVSAEVRLFISDATLWTTGKTCELMFIPEDLKTYASSVNIPLTATSSTSGNPSHTLSVLTKSFKSVEFRVTCTQHGKFVYHISRKYSYNQTACKLDREQIDKWLSEQSIDGLRVDQTYYECQDYIGLVNIKTPKVSQTLTIDNLKASTSYLLTGYCQSQIGTFSNLVQSSFQTRSNGGYVSKMTFTFQSPLTSSQKVKMVCALALKFEINYKKVSTSDGFYCSELLNSRRLLQQNPRRFLATASNDVVVYFGINNDLNSDGTPTKINSQSVSKTGIQDQLKNVVGLPNLVSMSVSQATFTGTNPITSDYFIDVGPTYVYIEGLSMPNNGLIYVIIGKASLWPRDPVISEIKKGSGPNGLPPLFFKILGYKTSQASSSYVSYTGMPDENMTVYILGSDDNPFDDANFQSIIKHEISAEIPTWEKYALSMYCVLLVILMLC